MIANHAGNLFISAIAAFEIGISTGVDSVSTTGLPRQALMPVSVMPSMK